MLGNRLLLGKAFGKVVALQNLPDGNVRCETHKTIRTKFRHPFRVEAYLSLVRIEQFENLSFVSFGVCLDFFASKLGTGGRLSRRVADQSGEIPDQKNRGVAQLLKRPQFANDDRMTEVKIGRA